ncbi:MAG: hypothetical protein E4G96_05660 [Chrysiogenales bacterium]|nr:MAG: hypothetical protein E4G96_05660 [Chrysiogenales bacterium]
MMKPTFKKIKKEKDDSLYGLLSANKSSNTYIRIMISEEDDSVVVQLTDNPRNFQAVSHERYKNYRILRRLEIGVPRISLKYVTPEKLTAVLGPMIDFNIPFDKAVIVDGIQKDGIYSIMTKMKYKLKIIQGARKILNLSPQKRYEILEKYLSGHKE